MDICSPLLVQISFNEQGFQKIAIFARTSDFRESALSAPERYTLIIIWPQRAGESIFIA